MEELESMHDEIMVDKTNYTHSEIKILFFQNFKESYPKHILNIMTVKARRLSKCNLCLGIITSHLFSSYPLIVHQRGKYYLTVIHIVFRHDFMRQTFLVHPYGIWLPGIDKYLSPAYEITYVIDVVLAFLGCVMYIPFSNLFVNWVMFGIVCAKTLQFKLRNCCADTDKPEENVITEIKWCAKFHEKLIQ